MPIWTQTQNLSATKIRYMMGLCSPPGLKKLSALTWNASKVSRNTQTHMPCWGCGQMLQVNPHGPFCPCKQAGPNLVGYPFHFTIPICPYQATWCWANPAKCPWGLYHMQVFLCQSLHERLPKWFSSSWQLQHSHRIHGSHSQKGERRKKRNNSCSGRGCLGDGKQRWICFCGWYVVICHRQWHWLWFRWVHKPLKTICSLTVTSPLPPLKSILTCLLTMPASQS